MGRLLWVRCGKRNSSKRNSPKGNSLATDHCPLPTDRLEQVLKITDLLLQSNGFGMIVLDLADIPVLSARRIPLASWFRFRRAVEHTPTVLLVIEQQPIAGSCSSLLMQVSGGRSHVAGFRCDEQTEVSAKKPSAFSHQHRASGIGDQVSGKMLSIKWAQSADQEKAAARPSHTELLDQFEITAELLRSRLERKPAQSVVNFRSCAKWAR